MNWSTIRQAISEDRYVIGLHAAEQMEARRIMDWQVIAGTPTASVLREVPDAQPHPKVEVDVTLADGVRVKAVWSWLARARVAKLVTVHYYD